MTFGVRRMVHQLVAALVACGVEPLSPPDFADIFEGAVDLTQSLPKVQLKSSISSELLRFRSRVRKFSAPLRAAPAAALNVPKMSSLIPSGVPVGCIGTPPATKPDTKGTGQKAKKKTRKRGLARDTDTRRDQQIDDAWNTGNYKTYSDLAQRVKIDDVSEITRALDRCRKRPKPEKETH